MKSLFMTQYGDRKCLLLYELDQDILATLDSVIKPFNVPQERDLGTHVCKWQVICVVVNGIVCLPLSWELSGNYV